MSKLTLCLDWDGVIHSYTSGWKGADVIPDPPVPGALAFLVGAVEHFNVAIYSSRSHQYGGIEAMQRWLRHHLNAAYDADGDAVFHHIEFPTHKPAAFVSIDDRTLTFDGTWPTIDALKAFKPWNKLTANERALVEVTHGGAASLLLSVQQDCIRLRKLLVRARVHITHTGDGLGLIEEIEAEFSR